jgi:hypothetical protein
MGRYGWGSKKKTNTQLNDIFVIFENGTTFREMFKCHFEKKTRLAWRVGRKWTCHIGRAGVCCRPRVNMPALFWDQRADNRPSCFASGFVQSFALGPNSRGKGA